MQLNDAEEKTKARMDPPTRLPTNSKSANAADDRYTVTNLHPDDIVDINSAANSVKREKVKQALLSMLPPYDQLLKLFNSNADWWQTWRRKCSGTSSPDQTLSQFAVQALTTGNIGAISTVVLAVGICASDDSDDVDKYIECVDRWVLSDDEFAATLEGIECLILKSKWYADVGQPRRAWLSYRKGLMYAQLMVCPSLVCPQAIANHCRACIASAQTLLPMRASGGRCIMAIASSLCFSAFLTASTTRTAT